MPDPNQVDIAAVLAAVYHRPTTGLDDVASRVRTRIALVETLGECARLLTEVPGYAISASLSGLAESLSANKEAHESEDGQ